MWINGRKGARFQKAEFRESNEALGNPGCGWYHVYPFVIRVPSELSLEETKLCISDISRDERLVLVRIDIGDFRAGDIPAEALEDIFRIFDLFHISQKQMILRFTYDSVGKGMEREPQDISIVKRHMNQLGKLICRFASDILVLQGIFVGSWGEMHHSKFLTVFHMSELLGCLYRAVGDSCYLAVRTPEQWRSIMACAGTDPALKKRVGLFNDGMFGSPTDLGTYQAASRQEELEWQSRSVASVPNGGEAVADERPVRCRQAVEEMAKMHLCYLNSSYQQEQLDYWKKERVTLPGCWKGISGYEYIGRHLGSRFVICDAKAHGGQMEIVIENCGFSRLHEEAECFLVWEEVWEEKSGRTGRRRIDANASEWESGKKTILRIPLPDTGKEAEESRVFFQMRRKNDGRSLRFANQGAGDRVLLGILKYR